MILLSRYINMFNSCSLTFYKWKYSLIRFSILLFWILSPQLCSYVLYHILKELKLDSLNHTSSSSRAGEPDLLFRNVPVRTHETDQPGGSCGRGSRRLFPRVPWHAGGVTFSQGQRKISFYFGVLWSILERGQYGSAPQERTTD